MSTRSHDLVDRLRGIYTVPVNDGWGLLDGKDTFTRTFPVPPIQDEAANEIQRLRIAVLKLWDLRYPGADVADVVDIVRECRIAEASDDT